MTPVPNPAPGLVRRLLAIVLVCLLFGACASVHTSRHPDPSLGQHGGVAFALYADDEARAEGTPGLPGVLSVLERREGDNWVPIFRGLRPSWATTGLEPGRYRVRIPARLDATGLEVPLEDVATKEFRVRAAEMVEVAATMRHVSRGLVAAGIVAGVIAAVALHEWLGDHGLPKPPLPPPPPLWVADLTLSLVLDFSTWDHGPDLDDSEAAPFVLSGIVPEPGSEVPAGAVRVVLAFAADPGSVVLAPERIVATSSERGELDGTSSYDAGRWWLVWTPAEPLEAGETITVNIEPEALRGRGGRTLPAALATSFSVGDQN